MNLADKMEIFNDIEDQYLLEAMPKRLLAHSTKNLLMLSGYLIIWLQKMLLNIFFIQIKIN